ncbi:MAG: DnaD domain protein [Lachnospiraceae bacterium]|nr:DnaD domain protein [Lachnospiraceae bacterium]
MGIDRPVITVKEKEIENRMLNVTPVSDIFIDEYMAEANGEYVKVYMYLLRVLSDNGRRFSIPDICNTLSYTALDVTRALMYWEEKGLLRLSFDAAGMITEVNMLRPVSKNGKTASNLENVIVVSASSKAQPAELQAQHTQHIQETVPPAVNAVAPIPANLTAQMPQNSVQNVQDTRFAASEPPVQNTAAQRVVNLNDITPPQYSKEELDNFHMNDEITELIAVAEGYMRHPLSVNDMNSIIFWYDSLGLPIDVIEYLMEYCMENGHQSIRYMHKCAIDWANNGIYTLSEAKQRNRIHQKAYYSIIKAFGIKDRNLIPSEIELMEKWTKEYRMSIPVIEEAAKRSVRNTGRVSFNYADSILKDWKEAGVNSPEDIQRLDAQFAKKNAAELADRRSGGNGGAAPVKKTGFHNFDERQNDYAALESMALKLN